MTIIVTSVLFNSIELKKVFYFVSNFHYQGEARSMIYAII